MSDLEQNKNIPPDIMMNGLPQKKRWSRKQMIIAVIVGIPLMSCCCLMTYFQLFISGTPEYKADMTANAVIKTANFAATATEKAKPTNTPTDTPPPTNTPKPTKTPTPLPTNTPTPIPLGSTRDNPIPAKTWVDYGGGVQLAIAEMVRPATNAVMSANQFNTKPGDGEEYIQLAVGLRCNKESSEKCSFSPYSLSAVGSDGNIRPIQMFVAGVADLLDSNDMFGGAEKAGWTFFIVPEGDEKVVIFFDGFFSDPVYMALPEPDPN